MTTLHLSPDVAALNPSLSQRDQRAARLRGDGYASGLERRAAREWLPQLFAWFKYEEVKLRIPGDAWYTPDFFGETRGGVLAFVECKGYTRTLRADKLRYNAAREIHDWAYFCWLEWDRRDGWIEKWNVKP